MKTLPQRLDFSQELIKYLSMALSVDIGPGKQGSFTPEVQIPIPSSGVIFDPEDPRLNEVSREERIRLYYARELAAENFNALTPRSRVPEDGSEQEPWRDFMVADPLSDPQIGVLASTLKAAGYEPEPDELEP